MGIARPRILVIEPASNPGRSIAQALKAKPEVEVRACESFAELAAHLESFRPDLVLAPDGSDRDFLAEIKASLQSDKLPPIIMVAEAEQNSSGYDAATRSLRLVRGAEVSTELLQQIVSETSRDDQVERENEERYRLLFEHSGLGIGYWTVDGILLSFNRVALEQLGDIERDLAGKSAGELFGPEMAGLMLSRFTRVVEEKTPLEFEDFVRMPGGGKWYHSTYTVIVDRQGNVLGIQVTSRNITEWKLAEEKVRTSEANLHALIESTGDLIASRDLEGRLVVFNRSFANILKKLHGIEARPGLRTTEYLPQSQKAHWEAVLDKVNRGESHREEFSWSFDGELRHYELSLDPIRTEGKVIGSTEFTRDITATKKAAEHLRYQSRLLENTADAIVATDLEYNTTAWNPGAERVYGWQAEEVLGRTITLLLQSTYKTGDRETAMQQVRENGLWEGEVVQRRKDGKEIHVAARVAAVYGAGNELIGYVASNTDITDRIAIEQNLQQAHAQLQAEHQALEEKNITLREVLGQIQEHEKQLAIQAQANIEKVVMPTLRQLERKVPPSLREHVLNIQRDLKGIFSPLVSELERQYAKLSPREITICNMIRAGLSTKEIADDLGTSIETVRSQRKQIRRKLGISGRKINLASYLASIENR